MTIRIRLRSVLLAWYFAVVGGTIGPFDSLADCNDWRLQYKAGALDDGQRVGWTSKCWEATR